LLRTIFVTGYQWASQEFTNLIASHFDAIGNDFYDLLNTQLVQVSPHAKQKIILTVYHNGDEYCILSKRFVHDYFQYLSNRPLIDLEPRNHLPGFASFLFLLLKEKNSPFRVALDRMPSIRMRPMRLRLKDEYSTYYRPDKEFSGFMRTMYGDDVIFHPLASSGSISLGCNYSPEDQSKLEPELAALALR
jgi:hypothetical protein